MTAFTVPVVKLQEITKHPNADSLSMALVDGVNVIFRTGDFSEGDLAIYIPYDSIVDVNEPRFTFLSKGKSGPMRIKPVRLRGTYSEGVLLKIEPDMVEGQDVQALINVKKYVQPEEFSFATENESDPQYMPKYDVDPYLKYRRNLIDNEEIVVTEKLHGCNGRYLYRDDRLWVGSHGCIKKYNKSNLWWKIAKKLDVEQKLAQAPNLAFYGEVYGQVQDLKYGVPKDEGFRFRCFDVYDTLNRRYLDWDEANAVCLKVGIERVPELYRGPYIPSVVEPLRSGKSTLDSNTIREGIVLRSVKERYTHDGRVVYKYVSEEYKLRNGGTEHK